MGRLVKNSDKSTSAATAASKKKKEEEELNEELEVEEGAGNDDDFESCDDEEGQEEEEAKNSDSEKKNVSLYDLLDVPKDTKIEDIKKAYKKLALKIHPDKNRDDPLAKERFQKIVEAYDILSDPEKKKIYDETGSYGDDFNQAAFDSAYSFYRTIYKKIEKKDIEDFEAKYRGSDMEDEDLLNFYNENNGDLTKILECIPLSRNEDVPRFIERYEEFLATERIKLAKHYKKSKNNIQLLDEGDEEGFEEEQQKSGIQDLAQQILSRRGDATSFLDQLAMKYGGSASKKTKSSSSEGKFNAKAKAAAKGKPKKQFGK